MPVVVESDCGHWHVSIGQRLANHSGSLRSWCIVDRYLRVALFGFLGQLVLQLSSLNSGTIVLLRRALPARLFLESHIEYPDISINRIS
jgi:hypothetical protein